MSIKKTTFLLISNEQDFIKGLINFIVNNSNGKITCPDYASIDATNSSSSFIKFNLRFLDKYNIEVRRNYYNNTSNNLYVMRESNYGNNVSKNFYFKYTYNYTPSLTQICERRAAVTLITTNKICLLKIEDVQPIIFIDDIDYEWYYWGDYSNINFCPKRTNKTTEQAISAYQFNRFPYYCNRTNFNDIEVAGNKIFVNSNSSSVTKQRVFDTNLFLDCSYVPSDCVLFFNNKKYYTLNSNLLIPVD